MENVGIGLMCGNCQGLMKPIGNGKFKCKMCEKIETCYIKNVRNKDE